MDAAQREAWDKTLVEVHQEVRSHASEYAEAGRWLDSEYSEQRCRELRSAAESNETGIRRSAQQIHGSTPVDDARCWRLSCVVMDFHAEPPDLRVAAVHGEPVLWARRVLLVAALVSDPKAHEYAANLTELASLPWFTKPPFRCRVAAAPTDPNENWSEPWTGLIRTALQRVRRDIARVMEEGGVDEFGSEWKKMSIGEAVERAIALLSEGEQLRSRIQMEAMAGNEDAANQLVGDLAILKLNFDRLAAPFVHVAYYLNLDGQPLDLLIRTGDPTQVERAVRVLRQIQAEHLRRLTARSESPLVATEPTLASTAAAFEQRLDTALRILLDAHVNSANGKVFVPWQRLASAGVTKGELTYLLERKQIESASEVVNGVDTFGKDEFLVLRLLSAGIDEAMRRAQTTVSSGRGGQSKSEGQPPCEFRLVGEIWHVAFGGIRGTFKNRVGFSYLAILLGRPGENPLTPTALKRLVEPPPSSPVSDESASDMGVGSGGSSQPIIEPERLKEHREALQEVREELASARASNDTKEIERLEEVESTLLAALGLGGVSRSFDLGTELERVRKQIVTAMGRAYSALEEANPPMTGLVQHLRDSISGEGGFAYRPSPSSPDWQL